MTEREREDRRTLMTEVCVCVCERSCNFEMERERENSLKYIRKDLGWNFR